MYSLWQVHEQQHQHQLQQIIVVYDYEGTTNRLTSCCSSSCKRKYGKKREIVQKTETENDDKKPSQSKENCLLVNVKSNFVLKYLLFELLSTDFVC